MSDLRHLLAPLDGGGVDYSAALAAFLAEQRDIPFVWGASDCCLFAADWALAVTGDDPAGDLRGGYDNAANAWRVIVVERGRVGLISRSGWADRVGDPRIGDVGLIGNTPKAPAIFAGGSSWYLKGPTVGVSLVMSPIITRIWAAPE